VASTAGPASTTSTAAAAASGPGAGQLASVSEPADDDGPWGTVLVALVATVTALLAGWLALELRRRAA
jgi:hypothetical protein